MYQTGRLGELSFLGGRKHAELHCPVFRHKRRSELGLFEAVNWVSVSYALDDRLHCQFKYRRGRRVYARQEGVGRENILFCLGRRILDSGRCRC
jgi:hypothetical protein